MNPHPNTPDTLSRTLQHKESLREIEVSRNNLLIHQPLKMLRVAARLLEFSQPSAFITPEELEETRHGFRDVISRFSFRVSLAIQEPIKNYLTSHTQEDDVELANSQWTNRLGRPGVKEMTDRARVRYLASGFFLSDDIGYFNAQAEKRQKGGALEHVFFLRPDEIQSNQEWGYDSELDSNRGTFGFRERVNETEKHSDAEIIERSISENILEQALIILEKMKAVSNERDSEWAGVGPLPLPVGELKIPVRMGSEQILFTVNVDGKVLRKLIDAIQTGKASEDFLQTLLTFRQSIQKDVQTSIATSLKVSQITPEDVSQAFGNTPAKGRGSEGVYPFAINLLSQRILNAHGMNARVATSCTNGWETWSVTELFLDQDGRLITKGQNFAHSMIDGREAKRIVNNESEGFSRIQRLLNHPQLQPPHAESPFTAEVSALGRDVFATSRVFQALQEKVPDNFHEMHLTSEAIGQLRAHHDRLVQNLLLHPDRLAKMTHFIMQGAELSRLLANPEANKAAITALVKKEFSFHSFLSIAFTSLMNRQGELLVINAHDRVNPALTMVPTALQEDLRQGRKDADQDREAAVSLLMSLSVVQEEKDMARDPRCPATSAFRLSATAGAAETFIDFASKYFINPEKRKALQEDKVQISFLSGENRDLWFQGALSSRHDATVALYENKTDGNASEYRVCLRTRKDAPQRRMVPVPTAVDVTKRCNDLFSILEDYFEA